jgi:hypothetical protein
LFIKAYGISESLITANEHLDKQLLLVQAAFRLPHQSSNAKKKKGKENVMQGRQAHARPTTATAMLMSSLQLSPR